MMAVPSDVILLPESSSHQSDRWVAFNVFARSALGINSDVVRVLGAMSSPGGAALEGTFRCWEIEWFSNERGLLADPTRWERDVSKWRELTLDGSALLQKLQDHFIVINDEASYRARFQQKRHLLDRARFGNFHQQLGTHLAVTQRANPVEWWVEQKFTADRRAVRSETLYGAVQAHFLDSYFPKRIRPGMHVVDLGCGTGVYSNAMAKCGATVLGVDPEDSYLSVGRSHAAEGAQFQRMNVGEPRALDAIPTASADLVFMSDALLFYFVPVHPSQHADITTLLADIRRILKPSGAFVSMEPHGVFYLAPWLGDADRPFTVVTEYMHRTFGITPSLSALVRALTAGGFALTNLEEIGPGELYEAVDPRGYHFAREFPLWQLLELRPFDK